MRIRLRPSFHARLLRFAMLPGALFVVFAAVIASNDSWALICLPLVLLAILAVRLDRAPAALEFRGDALHLCHGAGKPPGSWYPVQVRPGARVGAFAIELPVQTSDGQRSRLTLWRDAMTESEYRRLARRVRSGRWPGADGESGVAER